MARTPSLAVAVVPRMSRTGENGTCKAGSALGADSKGPRERNPHLLGPLCTASPLLAGTWGCLFQGHQGPGCDRNGHRWPSVASCCYLPQGLGPAFHLLGCQLTSLQPLNSPQRSVSSYKGSNTATHVGPRLQPHPSLLAPKALNLSPQEHSLRSSQTRL